MNRLSPAALSVMVFGIYMAGQGALLLFVPNVLLGLVGLPLANEVWVRVVGWVLLVLAYYYTRSALLENKDFFRWSMQIRLLQFVCFGALVGLKMAAPMLLLFSTVEAASGVWTAMALRTKTA
jgi:hypothetical protein